MQEQPAYIEIAKLNRQATSGTADGDLFLFLTDMEDKLRKGILSYEQFATAILTAYPVRIGQYVKPPFVVFAARTNQTMVWESKEGTQKLGSGGYVLISASLNKDGQTYSWDIWGVGDDYMSSYGFDDNIAFDDVYLQIVGKYVTDLKAIIPELKDVFQLGNVQGGLDLPFRPAAKVAPVLAFFAQADYKLYSQESDGGFMPYEVKKGEPILIGVKGEPWKRNLEAFLEQYTRVDTLALSLKEITEFYQQLTSGALTARQIERLANEHYLRIKYFGIAPGSLQVASTIKYVSYTRATTENMRAVQPEDLQAFPYDRPPTLPFHDGPLAGT